MPGLIQLPGEFFNLNPGRLLLLLLLVLRLLVLRLLPAECAVC